MRRVLTTMVGVSLGLALALGLGWVMAREAGAASLAQESTPTPPPITQTHPVALALARWISQTFSQAGITVTISVTDLMALQAQGFGYGEIARALQLVLAAQTDGDPTNDLTLEQALALGRQIGWGPAYRRYHLHPGGRGLGSIMRAVRLMGFATPPSFVTSTLSTQSAPGFPPGLSRQNEKDHKPPRGNGWGRR